MTISSLTAAPDLPDRTEQDQTVFDNRMAAYWAYLKDDFEPELNVITGEIDTVTSTINGYKTDAETAETNAAASADLAEEWATTTNALVDATDYSAKEWANGTTANSAKQWATKTGSTVDGVYYSAKYYATLAEIARDTALNYANATIYAAETTYAAGDVVLDPGASYKPYISQQGSNTGNTPNTDDGTWWERAVESPRAGATTISSAVDITLTAGSDPVQQISMTAAEKFVNLPAATGLEENQDVFTFFNDGNYRFGVKDNAGTFICSIGAKEYGRLSLVDNSTAAGTWRATDGADLIMARLKTVCNTMSLTTYIASCKLTSTEVLVAWQGTDNDGFCAVLTWTGSAITVSNELEFDTGQASHISCCRMTDTVGIIGYSDVDLDGQICAVTYDGVDTLTLTDQFEFKDSETIRYVQVLPIYPHATTGKIGIVYSDSLTDINAQVIDWDGTNLTSDTAQTNIYTGSAIYISAELLAGTISSAIIAITFTDGTTQSIKDVVWAGGNTLSSPSTKLNIGNVSSKYVPVVALSDEWVIAFPAYDPGEFAENYASLIYYSGTEFIEKKKIKIGSMSAASAFYLYPQSGFLIDSETVGLACATQYHTAYPTKIFKIKAVGATTPEDCVLVKESELEYDENQKEYSCVAVFDSNSALFIYQSTNDSGYLTAEKIDIGD